jgi:hypothetical protein
LITDVPSQLTTDEQRTSWSEYTSIVYPSEHRRPCGHEDIGGGITEQFVLYYENRVAWFSTDVFTLRGEQSLTTVFSVGLLGASYYTKAEAPSLYALGSIGTSTWMTPFESGTDSFYGLGVSAGFGYEFRAHWGVEATVNWGNPKKDSAGVERSYSGLSVLVTVGAMAYCL